MPTSIDLGYGGLVCRELRRIGGGWEVSCGTLVGYSENDYTLSEDKQNSLGHSLSSEEFLRCLPLSLIRSPKPKRSVTELLANPEFNY